MMSEPSVHRALEESYERLFGGAWRAYAYSGACLIPLGLTLLLFPVFLGGGLLVYAGGLLAAAGGQILFSTINARHLPGSFTSFLLGLVSLLAGICLARDIFWVSSSLIPFFASYFILAGFLLAVLAESHRHRLSGNWEWLMVSAILSLNLALVSLSRLPEAFSWIFSVFLGLHVLIYGSALLAVALTSEEYRTGHIDVRAGLSAEAKAHR